MNGTEIKELRQRLQLTKVALADKLGVTRQTIDNWETKKKRPSPLAERQLQRLARKGAPNDAGAGVTHGSSEQNV